MLNRVVLMGRLVADPELKTTNTGISVTSFRIAVDRSYVKAGAERETDFFDIVAWRSSAEFVCRNFSKGSLIAIDGQLQSRQYQTKDGQNRTAIEVVADNVSFTGERREPAHNDPPVYPTEAPGAEVPYPKSKAVYPDELNANLPANYNGAENSPANYNGAAYGPRYQQGQITPDYGKQPRYQQGYQQPQYAPGAAYDPRDPQGTLAPNGDLPF